MTTTKIQVFDHKMRGALILGAALLALVLVFAHRSIDQVRLTSAQARATQDFRLQLDAISETILNMETGQRGYMLTSSVDYLQPYERGRQALPGETHQLESLATGSTAQRANLTALAELVATRRAQMEHALQLYRTVDPARAMEFMRTNRGHATMAQIRKLLLQMSAEEERALTQRRAEEARSLRRNFWFTAALSVLVCALIVAVYLLFRREMRTRALAAEQLDATNASLESRVRESTQHLSEANEVLRSEIEQRKLVESELQESHELLEARVRERTAELVEASAARARFLSAANHDLRQPLQSLMLLNATLSEQPLSPLAARIVESQRNSLESMSRLVHALLSVNRLRSGNATADIQDFPLAEMLMQLRAEFTPLARARQIALSVERTEACVRSDPTLLREIVQNLLSNAVRYTEHGEVSVRVRTFHDLVRLEVTDTGPGIPADKRELIFEEFQQLRPRSGGRSEGFGLGLSIVRHAARLLGLQVDLASEPGAGSTFSLAIPLADARNVPQSAAAHRNADAPPAVGRILLVDDEAGVRTAIALFLSVSGHDVVAASSSEEALERLQGMPPPDVVISDYQLGGGQTGVELIQAVRTQLNATVPAVILTGDTLRGAQQRASLENCRVFHKPVDAQQLAEHLQAILGRRVGASDANARATCNGGK